MGPGGTIKSAQDWLYKMPLLRLKVNDQAGFQSVLDQSTEELQNALPFDGQHWGSARKFLNIFLRSVVYNKYLCEYYGISHIEPWLEVPLDSHVAKGLGEEAGGENLPKFRTVISLKKEDNKNYQDFALIVAEKEGTQRVHLDLLYWRGHHLKIKTVDAR